MAKIDLPDTDSGFRRWVLGFAENAAIYQAELGLSEDQIEELETLAADYSSAYAENEIYQNFARSKVATKNDARAAAEARFRDIGKFILANSDVSVEVKTKLGMSASRTSPAPLTIPNNLVVTGGSNGANTLQWDRNGNSVHTIFIVEARVGEDKDWRHVAATKRVKFVHTNQIPGQQIIYRVKSQRNGQMTSSSNTAVIYSSTPRTNPLPKAA